MPTLIPQQQTTQLVGVGQTLDIDANALGRGSVVRLSNPVGGEPYAPVQYSGARLSFGPYDVIALFRIACDAGSLAYSVNGRVGFDNYTKTIRERQRTTLYVAPGAKLTVTGAGVGWLVPINADGSPGAPINYAGSTLTIDATETVRTFRAVCTSGEITFTTAYVDLGIPADALVSPLTGQLMLSPISGQFMRRPLAA